MESTRSGSFRMPFDAIPATRSSGSALVMRWLTPPAEFAYRRAAELSPGYPAAPFFFGLALARSGDRQAAVAIWKRILDHAPADASWRPLIEQGVTGLSAPAPMRG